MNQELTEQEIKERLGEEAYEEQENIMLYEAFEADMIAEIMYLDALANGDL